MIAPPVVNSERSRLAQREPLPRLSGPTDDHKSTTIVGTWTLFNSSAIDQPTRRHTPAPAHPSAPSNSNSPATQDPAHQFGCRKYLESLAQAEVQLNSETDYRSARLTRKRIRRVRASTTVRGDGGTFDLPKIRTEFSASASQ
jgi:hypothetical protein